MNRSALASLRITTRRAALLLAVAGLAPLLSSCDTGVHAIVGPTNPIPPPGQPIQFASLVSSTCPNADPDCSLTTSTNQGYGLASVIDVAGDSVLPVLQIGNSPVYTVVTSGGSQSFSINQAPANKANGSVSIYTLGQNTLSSSVLTTTLANGSSPGGVPGSGTSVPAFWSANRLYVTEPTATGGPVIDELSSVSSAPYAEIGQIAVQAPVNAFAGTSIGPIIYGIESSANQVEAFQQNTSGVDTPVGSPVPVGTNPVYGVMAVDGRRAFIVNKGSNSVTAINVQTNQVIATIPVGSAPVWADEYNAGSVLVVANSGDDTVSVIDAAENSDTFGTVLKTVHLADGANPVNIVVRQDGAKAYTANVGRTASDQPSIGVINIATGNSDFGAATTVDLPAGYYPFEVTISSTTTLAKVYALTYTTPPACANPPAGCSTPPVNPILTVVRTYTNEFGSADTIEAQIPVNGTPRWIALTPSR